MSNAKLNSIFKKNVFDTNIIRFINFTKHIPYPMHDFIWIMLKDQSL